MMQPNNQYFQPQVPSSPQQGQVSPSMYQAPSSGMNGSHKSSAPLILTIIVLFLLLILSLVFGFWAFAQMQDYKNNTDEKIAAAVVEAEKLTTEKNTAAFLDEKMKVTKTYVGPSSYGSITVVYPEGWSGYIATENNGNEPLNAMFHPDVVPALVGNSDNKPAIALSVKVVNEPYDSVIQEAQQFVEDGSATAVPYALPKMPDQVGLKLNGKLSNEFNGTQVIIPLRDKTIVITAETDQFAKDLETYILPFITFVP